MIVATGGTAPASRPRRQPRPSRSSSSSGDDPVRLGLVASLARPGGNLTGINFFTGELVAKRLELLRELVPAMPLVWPCLSIRPMPRRAESTLRDVERRPTRWGCKFRSSTPAPPGDRRGLCGVCARAARRALRQPDPFFISRRVQLATLAARHAIPASYSARDYVEAGGLMSYGTNVADAYRQVGVYAGRILKGAKPADLPVVQSTKFELVINAQTARHARPDGAGALLARADEVIE